MKVFLDIGAHVGETLEVVLDPRWAFDRIVCFEPAPSCWSAIRSLAEDRVEICEFGLWKEDATVALHNPGAVGASVFAEKDPVDDTADCEFHDAAKWFDVNLRADDTVFVKINAEGAEVDIIQRLADAGHLAKIDQLLVHFDVRKISSLRHREEMARMQLERAGVEYHSADEIEYGGVRRGTRNWLRWCEGGRGRDFRYKTLARVIEPVRRRLYPTKRAALVHRGSKVRLSRRLSS